MSVAVSSDRGVGHTVSAALGDGAIELTLSAATLDRVVQIELTRDEAIELGEGLLALATELALELNRVKPPRVPLYRGTEGP